ncbi:hypothetical protein EGH24_11940 [Halonotius terrestris]|uniref:Uncharacterized protein n=1 Tax=Halonotius terrestris TaxID=2487750 RepID=A0A8J8P848_9EURY|nr:DUF6069 family protein [Halonotius terrestris]TQQ79335.1 hypothetical protein EGH24_11940 [Halonotius terrestris]
MEISSKRVRYPVPESGVALARRTTLGVVVAIVALLLTQAIVTALGIDVGASGEMSPFAAGPLIGTTLVSGIGAAVVYTVVAKFTDKPARNFIAVAVGVFVLMLVPVAVVSPSMGVTAAGQAILVLYHVLVAVPLVAFIIGAVDV